LRHGMRSLVERFDQTEAPRIRRIDSALGPPPDEAAP
jgi:hypothetical protein